MRHRWCVAAALSLAAFSFQAWIVLGLEGLPQFSKYPVASSQLLEGTLVGERALDFSPLYTLLFAVFGKYLPDPATKVLWFQIALIALTPGFFYLVVSRHFGRLPSLCGAVAFVLSPSLVIAGYVFEPEALLVFLTAWGLDDAGRRFCGVQVVRDPGAPLFWAGCILLALAVPAHLLLKGRGAGKAAPGVGPESRGVTG